jgi:type II secretory pathway pseudopilin PulG
MPLLARHFAKTQSPIGVLEKKEMQQGFILLEALIAMSLIVGVWMGMVQIYQGLALRQIKIQSEKAQLRKESDAFETQEQRRVNSNLPGKVLSNESARVSSRDRAVRTSTKSTIKNQR